MIQVSGGCCVPGEMLTRNTQGAGEWGWDGRNGRLRTPLALAAVAESAGPIAGGGPAKGTSQSCLAADAAS